MIAAQCSMLRSEWGRGEGIQELQVPLDEPGADTRRGPLPAGDGDQRVTCVGRFLQATALDELPKVLGSAAGATELDRAA